MKAVWITLVIAIAALVGACSHMPVPSVVIKPSPAEVALDELAKKETAKRIELEKKLADAEVIFKQKFDANISLGSASVIAGLDTLIADPTKTRHTEAAIPAFQVAVEALPSPSVADLRKTMETQRKLLSSQAKEIEDGKKEIAAQKQEATANKEAQKKAEQEKVAILQEQQKVAQEFSNEKSKLTQEVVEFKNESIRQSETARALEAAKAQREIEDAKSRKALEKWIITILMICGVIAAVISYVVKSPGQIVNPVAALGAAGFIGLAIALGFLPLWAIFVSLAVVFGCIIFAVIRSFKQYKDIAVVSVGGIQEHKDENPEGFKNTLATKIRGWTKGDEKLEKLIDKVAEDINVK